MSEMTIAEVMTMLREGGILAVLVIFIVGIFGGKVVVRWHHETVVKLLTERLEEQRENYESRVTDLENRLADANKRGDEWQAMALSQHITVGRAVTLASSTLASGSPPPLLGKPAT